jgi:hypothetical protein
VTISAVILVTKVVMIATSAPTSDGNICQFVTTSAMSRISTNDEHVFHHCVTFSALNQSSGNSLNDGENDERNSVHCCSSLLYVL